MFLYYFCNISSRDGLVSIRGREERQHEDDREFNMFGPFPLNSFVYDLQVPTSFVVVLNKQPIDG